MTAPGGFLDFFILEAGEYVEQIDAQLLAGEGGLDAEVMQRVARALRGSATMAKRPGISDIAAGVERVSRMLRDRQLEWTPALRGVLVAAVDDLRILLRAVRTWGAEEDARARARVTELVQYAPARPATPLASPTSAAHDSYLATESANIGAGLELLATRPSDRDAASNVLRRVRALRGIASVKDHGVLAEVLEAAELAAHPLELGEPTLSPERVALLAASATVLRTVAVTMRGGGALDPKSPDLALFTKALDAMQERETGADRVVPIQELFYEDGGATVVAAAANPPTSPAERFRLEVVSQGEHLRRVVSDARGARDDLSRERVRRGLRQALRSLRQAAESFGEQDVAQFVAAHTDSVVQLDAQALDALDDVATLLAQPAGAGSSLAERLQALQAARSASVMPAAAPLPRPTPSAPAALVEVATTVGGPKSGDLVSMLDSGIRNLGVLRTTPLTAPAAIGEQPPVPIERLLYRGRAAIERAREIRADVTRGDGGVDAEKLQELFDLLDLALTT